MKILRLYNIRKDLMQKSDLCLNISADVSQEDLKTIEYHILH